MTEEEASRDEKLVPVHEVPDEATGTMLCDFLNAQGIEAAATSAQMPWFGTIETARKGYWGRIEVLEHEAARAKELIRDFYAARPEAEPAPPSGPGQEGTG
jgi:hypothetical protein